MIHESLQTPVVRKTEILVVGGGVAGVAAAVTAARRGAQVTILEKSALFGGLATGGLISYYEPLCDSQGTQLIYGIGEELLKRAILYGPDTLTGKWREHAGAGSAASDEASPNGRNKYDTLYSPTMCQLAMDEVLQEAGVEILLDISFVRPIVEGGIIRGVITESISGREAILCEQIIDATGTAAVFHTAGAACVNGRNYFSIVAHRMDAGSYTNTMTMRKWVSCGSNLYGKGQPEGMPMCEGVTVEQTTDFLLSTRRALLDKLRHEDRFARDLISLPTMPQFREVRRIVGEYTMTEKDDHLPHDRSIGLISDFARPGSWYEIPYESLYDRHFDNLIAAGRIIAAEGWAWDATRVIPPCAVTGQAAAEAAVLAMKQRRAIKDVDIELLQKALREGGMRIHRIEA